MYGSICAAWGVRPSVCPSVRPSVLSHTVGPSELKPRPTPSVLLSLRRILADWWQDCMSSNLALKQPGCDKSPT